MTLEEKAKGVLSRVYGGLHHVPGKYGFVRGFGPQENDFPIYEALVSHGLATTDFDHLTRLVVAAHDLSVRVSIEKCNPQYLRLVFHDRRKREGRMDERCLTMEAAISGLRDRWGV